MIVQSRWSGWALLGAAGTCTVATAAHAQTFGTDDRGRHESRQDFALELRGGPYFPAIDREFGGSAFPARDIFGGSPNFTSDNQRVTAGLEFDWQIVRLWRAASLGVGVSGEFAALSEGEPISSNVVVGTPAATWGTRASAHTTLNVIPVNVMAVLRVDGLARHVPWLPLVPYVKLGLSYGVWWVTNGLGIVHVSSTQDAIGGSLGWHGAVGLSLMLDAFEPRMARELDAANGVNHSYVFFELYDTDLSGFGFRPQLNVGTIAWAVGLAFEW